MSSPPKKKSPLLAMSAGCIAGGELVAYLLCVFCKIQNVCVFYMDS